MTASITKMSLLVICSMFLLSKNSNPPAARTGAPGESTCALSGCHDVPNPNLSGSIVLSGVPTSALPNTSYAVTVTLTKIGTAAKAGYEAVSLLNGANTNTGTWTIGANQSLITSGSKTYIRHSPSVSFVGNNASYVCTWKTPVVADGTVINLYYAGVLADGGGDELNDKVVVGSTSTTINGSLPLLGLKLEGKQTNTSNEIHWFSQTESNMAAYLVEKSQNATSWSEMRSLAPKNNPLHNNYCWIDKSCNKSYYYRICGVEGTGKKYYSNVIYMPSRSVEMVMYPNPCMEQLQIKNVALDRSYSLKIIDFSGRVVREEQDLVPSNDALQINVADLPDGPYVLNLSDGISNTTRKFLKK